jgi:hypothetical protein
MQLQLELFDKWVAKKNLSTSDKIAGHFKEMSPRSGGLR